MAGEYTEHPPIVNQTPSPLPQRKTKGGASNPEEKLPERTCPKNSSIDPLKTNREKKNV